MSRWTSLLVAALMLSAAGCAKLVVVQLPGSDGAGQVARAGSGTVSAGGAAMTVAPQAKLKAEGVFYALPRTVARVVVKIDKVETESARYARFSAIFAPGMKPPCGTIENCSKLGGGPGTTPKYSVQQGAAFTTFGEPDPNQVFMVKFTGGGTLDQNLSMTWNEAGLLSAASGAVTNRTTDIVVSGVKMAALLVGKTLPAGGGVTLKARDTNQCPPSSGSSPSDGWIVKILEGVPGEMKEVLIANYCDLSPKDRSQYDPDRDGAALDAATRAYIVRVSPLAEQRTTLLASSSLNVLDPIKYLDRLDSLIDAQVKALFVGDKSTKTWEIPFEVRALKPGAPVKILGLSETKGVCPVKDLLAPDAKPAPDGFEVYDGCDRALNVSVRYHPATEEQLFARVRSVVAAPEGERSFSYVLPAQVKADVTMDGTTYGTGVFSVAQLGAIVSLPARRHSKTLSYDLAMIEATGGLKTFKLGTIGGLDAATIDALAGAGGIVLDARSARLKDEEARRKEAETAADELSVLTRQQTLLKLKDEICELQKKYGMACTVKF